MREEREVTGSGSRCMSPMLVKQTLANLKKDGESRNAMTSLRQCVEDMDEANVPRFVAQVSETREKGSSRAYAISLYEDVARVHGKLIIPQLHRVMSTVVRSLSSSGSSPQLQEACAKVLSTVAKHAIDESSPASGSEVLRDLCNPLLDVLAGKLEPLAAGAAVCLQTLVECENWKFASDDVVSDICVKTTVALADRSTRTASHMLLARALAMVNSSLFCNYGVAILRCSAEVLKSSSTASGSWQLRASAARLVTVMLPTVDRATIAEELAPVMRALDLCKHDRMSNVRWAVREALNISNTLLAEENSRRVKDGEEPLCWEISSGESPSSFARTKSFGESPSSLSRTRSGSSDDMMSPVSTKMSRAYRASSASSSPASPSIPVSPTKGYRGLSFTPPAIPVSPTRSYRGLSPSSSFVSLSPSASSDTPTSRNRAPPIPPSVATQQRSPLQATRLHIQVGPQDAASSVTSSNDFDSPRKENLPSQESDIKAVSVVELESSPSGIGRVGTYVRPRPSTPGGTFIPYPPPSPRAGHQPSMDSERNQERQGSGFTKQERASVVAKGGTPEAESKYESGGPPSVSEEGEQFEMKTPRDGGKDLSPNSAISRRQGVLDGSTMKHVFELKGPVAGNSFRNVRASKDGDDEAVAVLSSPTTNDSSNKLLTSPLRSVSPSAVELKNFGDAFRLQITNVPRTFDQLAAKFLSGPKSASVIPTDDFFPFTTPRRLVRSLQGSFSNTVDFPGGRLVDQDRFKLESRGDTTTTEMDLGTPTSSSTGWSVRTNPMASDESHKTESDDSDHEQGRPVWKKMVSDSSPSPNAPAAPHTPPVQEAADNPDNEDGFRHRLNHPGAGAAVEASQTPDALMELVEENSESEGYCTGEEEEEEEDGAQQSELVNETEIIKRTQQDTALGSDSGVSAESLKECIDDRQILPPTVEVGQASESADVSEVDESSQSSSSLMSPIGHLDLSRSGKVAPRIGKMPRRLRGGKRIVERKNLGDNIKGFLGWSWNQGRDNALKSWHVCVVVVAIPFAVIALSKVFFPPDHPRDPRYLRKRSNARVVPRTRVVPQNFFEF